MEELTGAGVYYGASPAEAAAVRGEDVAVIGAANSAGQAAIELAGCARRVTILCRGGSLAKSMSHYLVERIEALPNIDVRLDTTVVGASARATWRRWRSTRAASGRGCR